MGKVRMGRPNLMSLPFRIISILVFGFVSDFEFRISDFAGIASPNTLMLMTDGARST